MPRPNGYAAGLLLLMVTLGCAGGGGGLPIDPTTFGGAAQASDGALVYAHSGGVGDTKDAYLEAFAAADCLHLIEPQTQAEHLRCPGGRWKVSWKKKGEQVLVTLTAAQPPTLAGHALKDPIGEPWSAEALGSSLRCSHINTTFAADGSVTGGDPEILYATWKGAWTLEGGTLSITGAVEPTGKPIGGPGHRGSRRATAEDLATFPYTPMPPCEGALLARPADPKLAARHTEILCASHVQRCNGSGGRMSWAWVDGAGEDARNTVAKAAGGAWTSTPPSVVAAPNDTPASGLTIRWQDDDDDPTNPNKTMSTARRIAGALDANWNGIPMTVERTTEPQRAPVVVTVGSDVQL